MNLLSNSAVQLLRFVALPAMLLFAGATAHGASIEIVSPLHEETIHDNQGNVEVEVSAELDYDQRIRLLMDGTPIAPETRSSTIALEGIDRGEHVLKAQVLDDRGRAIAESEAVTFNMWQASAQFPNRNPPAQSAPPPSGTSQPQTAPLRTN